MESIYFLIQSCRFSLPVPTGDGKFVAKKLETPEASWDIKQTKKSHWRQSGKDELGVEVGKL